MKPRQFKRLAGLPKGRQDALVVEGLLAIGASVAAIADELEACNAARSFRAARLLHNVCREEAGKFLVLIDVYRSPGSDQATRSRQFGRARDHLSKLVYAQIADYSIGSQAELLRAVATHRQALYLASPHGYDWIFRNELLTERENALYVDLVGAEEELIWWTPHDRELPHPVPRSMRLVEAILTTGLASTDGVHALCAAWSGFDPHEDSHCSDWTARTSEALHEFPELNIENDRWRPPAWLVADRWPMPMVELQVEEAAADMETLIAKREARYEAEMRREFGDY